MKARLRFRVRPTLEPRAAYALWAPMYPPRAHNPLMRAEQGAMETVLSSLSPSIALDVGTGSGRYLPLLAQVGARTIVGVDFSWPMLARNPYRSLVCADATALPLRDGAFDLVVAYLMVGDVADLSRWLREVGRVLRPGGDLLYSDFHPSWARGKWERTIEGPDGRSFVIPRYAHAMSAHQGALVGAGFTVVDIRQPRLEGNDPQVAAFGQRWGNPPVIVVFHAARRDLRTRAGWESPDRAG